MKDEPQVTIVVPCYNAFAHLPGCVEAIIAATGDELGRCIRVHIQDGASTDGTSDYLDRLNIPGIDYRSEPDKGIYDAMNRAVTIANTPRVYFLGADDRLLPDFCATLPQLVNAETVYYGNVLYSYDMLPYDGYFSRTKLIYRNICHQAILYPREILLREPFDIRYRLFSDWATNIQLMAKYPFQYLERNLAVYNNTNGASALGDDSIFKAERHRLVLSSFGSFHYLLSISSPFAARIYQRFAKPRKYMRRGHN